MARLPTKDNLSGPASFRSGRVIASADTSAFGRGVASFGADVTALGRQMNQQNNAVDIARAEAYKTEQLLGIQNEFDADPDYATYQQRAPKRTGEVVRNAANLIRDPQMRERWAAGAQADAARVNDSIYDRGTTIRRQAETNALDEALEANRRLYVDPNTSEEVRAKARADIQGAIDTGLSTGLLTPDQADARKSTYIDGADFTRGELAVQRDPDILGSDESLPAGMRNNNPGNIKYVGQGRERGVVGPSVNTDQGDPQAVFETPEAGMREAYRLARSKYDGGKTTANQLIAGEGGWTPGNYEAAANIARMAGVGPDEDLQLSDPARAAKFMRALVRQEHGPSSDAYSDAMIAAAVSGNPEQDFPIVARHQEGRVSAPDMDGIEPAVLDRFKQVQNAFGRSIPIVSGFRDPARNRAAGGAKSSQHMHGNALDLDVSDMSEAERLELIRTASALGFTGIGVYQNSIHLDIGPRRAWGPSHRRASVPAWAERAIDEHIARRTISNPPQAAPDWYQRLAPEDRQKLQDQAKTRRKQIAVETRSTIEVAATNAPAAILATGQYDGALPTAQQFMDAYGPQDGAQRYNAFQADVETSQQAYGMRTMSTAEIEQMVAEATPVSSGDDAALERERYQTLSTAADRIIKAREADPAAYVRQNFPSVQQAWEAARDGNSYQAALTAMAEAQRSLGIAEPQLIPKDIAGSVVDRFKDESLGETERLDAVTKLVLSTPDPGQRQAIFDQLVEAGLPDTTQGAFEALARGDEGAARRLFQAAIVDPSKLPGQAPHKPATIDQAIQSDIMAEGEIGDVYYGLSDGLAENFVRAQRDAKLMTNAVNLRIRAGEDLDDAVAAAAKDLFGDVQPVIESGRVNAQILLPIGDDPEPVLEGLAALQPRVREALAEALAVPDDAPAADGTKAIMGAVGDNYIDRVMAEGFFRNSGNGFVFIDPFRGAAVFDAEGNPIIFSVDEAIKARPARDSRAPAAPLTDDAFDRFQARMGGRSGETATDQDGFPIDLSRQRLTNDDGSFSTEETTTVEIEGRWFNIPTIWDGRRLSEDKALARALKEIGSGWQFPNYATVEQAEAAAKKRSDLIGRMRLAQ